VLTTYEYDDHGRVVRAYTASAWTEEDRALMLAWDHYRKGLCPRCGHAKESAWHPDSDGWFEVTATYECHACTALAREGDPAAEPVEFHSVTDTRDYEKNPLPPFPAGPRMSPQELTETLGGAE
jgi:hypothetical protein